MNDAFLSEVEIRPAERLLYPSKDGTQIEGWVILPRGYDATSGKYPLILNIHGGPHGAYTNSFSAQFQLFAANGYAVLYTNPRGSTNYGEKFLWGTWGGWGNLDYEDVMAGVDHAMKRYAIDEKRLGVTGYSYGGFLTNWVITRTTKFAAAITGAGISNWISDYGTADIPRTKESEFFGTPWEPKGAERADKTIADYARGECDHADALYSRRGRFARADRTGGADVCGLKEAARPGEIHTLSRFISRRMVAMEYGASVLPGIEMVGAVSVGQNRVGAVKNSGEPATLTEKW